VNAELIELFKKNEQLLNLIYDIDVALRKTLTLLQSEFKDEWIEFITVEAAYKAANNLDTVEPMDNPKVKDKDDEPSVTKKKKKTKTVFAKIAKKCHPDKTDNTEFHTFFNIAKQYYERDQLDQLVILLSIINKQGQMNSMYELNLQYSKNQNINMGQLTSFEYRLMCMMQDAAKIDEAKKLFLQYIKQLTTQYRSQT